MIINELKEVNEKLSKKSDDVKWALKYLEENPNTARALDRLLKLVSTTWIIRLVQVTERMRQK